MAQSGEGGEKTEQPTARKLRKVREKGQVAKSTELSSALSLLVAMLATIALVPWFSLRVSDLMLAVERSLEGPLQTSVVHALVAASLELVMVASLLPLGVAVLLSVVATFLQTGPIFSIELVKPKMERMNPVSGLKQVFSTRSLVQLLLTLFKTAVIGVAIWLVLRGLLPDALRVLYHDAGAVLAVVGSALMQMLIWCGGLFVVLGFADFAYQRWQFLRDQRMSIQEIRREFREDEGDPLVKAQRRRPPDAWSWKIVSNSLNAAALVLTDRHGRVVALVYKPRLYAVPVYLLRASGERAEEVITRALALKIPIIESTELLSAMYVEAETAAPVSEPMAGDAIALLSRLRT